MNKKRGSALVAVLIVGVILNIGMTAMLQAMISYANMRTIAAKEVRARYLAEAGMQYAIAECRLGNFSSPIINLTGETLPIVITIGDPDTTNGLRKITVMVEYPDS